LEKLARVERGDVYSRSVARRGSTGDSLSEFWGDDSLEVIETISPKDPMYRVAPDVAQEFYFAAGREALRCMRLAMLAANLERPQKILDFGCGFGRILRTIKAAYPDVEITACDLRQDRVEFCSSVFGVTGVVSRENPNEIELDGPFDLIWSGSHLTHIEEDRWIDFVKLFESLLSARGVAVFTTYGRAAADRLRDGTGPLGMNPAQAAQVIRDYDESGFSFGENRAVGGGSCLASPAWVCTQLQEKTPNLELLLYFERGWTQQDVIACMKKQPLVTKKPLLPIQQQASPDTATHTSGESESGDSKTPADDLPDV
jgi:SAM-dependent methyltransferase